MIKAVFSVIGLACMVGTMVPAMAQDRQLTIQPYQGGEIGTPVDALPTPFSHGGSCVKLCQYDDTPCDPDYWKVADRRCNYNQRG